ncbi:MAG: pyridoxamine 5'-phosphate oxidase family protein [Paracoccaceae bacterium]|nr:pyridoxamine 5'-phosphate oxidase family protein [Loktanella sp.]
MSDDKQEFFDRLDKVQAGMLGLTKDGETVPMAPQLRKDQDGKIWFITAQGTDLVQGVAAGPQEARLVVADSESGLYANVEGKLSLSHDPDVLDELWSPMAAAWFEDDRKDPDVRLLCFEPSFAACWFNTTSGVKFLYEIAKANLSDTQPDTGRKTEVRF